MGAQPAEEPALAEAAPTPPVPQAWEPALLQNWDRRAWEPDLLKNRL
jgi:hypothetical protein